MLEFAFVCPLVLGFGLYGVETASLALAHLRISQIALNLADNASRVGTYNNDTAIQALQESDVNDVFAGARTQGVTLDLVNRGRITLSSLEADSNGVQRIHWQRCLGTQTGAGYDSSYGRTTTNGGTPAAADDAGAIYDSSAGINTATTGTDNSSSHPGSVTSLTAGVEPGMGEPGSKVTAPAGYGVMFVEINYNYLPVVSSVWLPGGSAKIHYKASFIVRDRRDFTELYDTNQVVGSGKMFCDKARP